MFSICRIPGFTRPPGVSGQPPPSPATSVYAPIGLQPVLPAPMTASGQVFQPVTVNVNGEMRTFYVPGISPMTSQVGGLPKVTSSSSDGIISQPYTNNLAGLAANMVSAPPFNMSTLLLPNNPIYVQNIAAHQSVGHQQQPTGGIQLLQTPQQPGSVNFVNVPLINNMMAVPPQVQTVVPSEPVTPTKPYNKVHTDSPSAKTYVSPIKPINPSSGVPGNTQHIIAPKLLSASPSANQKPRLQLRSPSVNPKPRLFKNSNRKAVLQPAHSLNQKARLFSQSVDHRAKLQPAHQNAHKSSWLPPPSHSSNQKPMFQIPSHHVSHGVGGTGPILNPVIHSSPYRSDFSRHSSKLTSVVQPPPRRSLKLSEATLIRYTPNSQPPIQKIVPVARHMESHIPLYQIPDQPSGARRRKTANPQPKHKAAFNNYKVDHQTNTINCHSLDRSILPFYHPIQDYVSHSTGSPGGISEGKNDDSSNILDLSGKSRPSEISLQPHDTPVLSSILNDEEGKLDDSKVREIVCREEEQVASARHAAAMLIVNALSVIKQNKNYVRKEKVATVANKKLENEREVKDNRLEKNPESCNGGIDMSSQITMPMTSSVLTQNKANFDTMQSALYTNKGMKLPVNIAMSKPVGHFEAAKLYQGDKANLLAEKQPQLTTSLYQTKPTNIHNRTTHRPASYSVKEYLDMSKQAIIANNTDTQSGLDLTMNNGIDLCIKTVPDLSVKSSMHNQDLSTQQDLNYFSKATYNVSAPNFASDLNPHSGLYMSPANHSIEATKIPCKSSTSISAKPKGHCKDGSKKGINIVKGIYKTPTVSDLRERGVTKIQFVKCLNLTRTSIAEKLRQEKPVCSDSNKAVLERTWDFLSKFPDVVSLSTYSTTKPSSRGNSRGPRGCSMLNRIRYDATKNKTSLVDDEESSNPVILNGKTRSSTRNYSSPIPRISPTPDFNVEPQESDSGTPFRMSPQPHTSSIINTVTVITKKVKRKYVRRKPFISRKLKEKQEKVELDKQEDTHKPTEKHDHILISSPNEENIQKHTNNHVITPEDSQIVVANEVEKPCLAEMHEASPEASATVTPVDSDDEPLLAKVQQPLEIIAKSNDDSVTGDDNKLSMEITLHVTDGPKKKRGRPAGPLKKRINNGKDLHSGELKPKRAYNRPSKKPKVLGMTRKKYEKCKEMAGKIKCSVALMRIDLNDRISVNVSEIPDQISKKPNISEEMVVSDIKIKELMNKKDITSVVENDNRKRSSEDGISNVAMKKPKRAYRRHPKSPKSLRYIIKRQYPELAYVYVKSHAPPEHGLNEEMPATGSRPKRKRQSTFLHTTFLYSMRQCCLYNCVACGDQPKKKKAKRSLSDSESKSTSPKAKQVINTEELFGETIESTTHSDLTVNKEEKLPLITDSSLSQINPLHELSKEEVFETCGTKGKNIADIDERGNDECKSENSESYMISDESKNGVLDNGVESIGDGGVNHIDTHAAKWEDKRDKSMKNNETKHKLKDDSVGMNDDTNTKQQILSSEECQNDSDISHCRFGTITNQSRGTSNESQTPNEQLHSVVESPSQESKNDHDDITNAKCVSDMKESCKGLQLHAAVDVNDISRNTDNTNELDSKYESGSDGVNIKDFTKLECGSDERSECTDTKSSVKLDYEHTHTKDEVVNTRTDSNSSGHKECTHSITTTYSGLSCVDVLGGDLDVNSNTEICIDNIGHTIDDDTKSNACFNTEIHSQSHIIGVLNVQYKDNLPHENNSFSGVMHTETGGSLDVAKEATEEGKRAVQIIKSAMTVQTDRINQLKELLRQKQEELKRVRSLRTCTKTLPEVDSSYLM